MQHFGKILGVIIGLLSGIGFWGLIIGIIIGYIADKINSIHYPNQKKKQTLFFSIVFQVMGHLTKSKGRVNQNDILMAKLLMKKMNLNSEYCIKAKNLFLEGKKNTYPLRQKLRELHNNISWNKDLIKTFLEIQINAAFADGNLHHKERNILYIIAEELGIKYAQFIKMLNIIEQNIRYNNNYFQGTQYYYYSKFFNNEFSCANNAITLQDAYNTLGVNENDDGLTIKRSYKKLMSKYHPDKLIAKGLSTNMINKAKKKAQKIKLAYDTIKKEKNIK